MKLIFIISLPVLTSEDTRVQRNAVCASGNARRVSSLVISLDYCAGNFCAFLSSNADAILWAPSIARLRVFRQQVWQCNDIRVTVTARDPFSIEYDLGGTIWGGSRFTVIKGEPLL